MPRDSTSRVSCTELPDTAKAARMDSCSSGVSFSGSSLATPALSIRYWISGDMFTRNTRMSTFLATSITSFMAIRPDMSACFTSMKSSTTALSSPLLRSKISFTSVSLMVAALTKTRLPLRRMIYSLEGDGARDGLGLERISQVFEQHGQRHAEAAQQANFRVKHEGEDEGHEHDEEVLLGQLPSHPKLVKVDEAEHSDHHHSSESRLRDVVEGIGQGAERNEHNHQGHGLGQGSLGTAVGVQRGAGEGAGHGVTGSDGVGEVAQSQGHKLLTGVQDRQLTACGGGLSGHGVALHVRDDGQGDHVQEHLAQGELKLGRAKDVQARRHLTHHLQVVAVVGIVVLEDLPGLVRGDDQAQQRGERGEEVVGLVSPGLLGLVGELVVSLENVEAEQRDVDAEGDVHGMNIDPAVTLAG
eukprot:Colp12_sorted_trinity150504_noHs@32159